MLKTLRLLSDPAVTTALETLKDTTQCPRNPTTGFDGSLAHVQVNTNLPSSSSVPTSAEQLHLNIPTPIKTEEQSQEKGRKLTLSDFDQMGSPKTTTKRSATSSRTGTPSKKMKTSEAQTPTDPKLLAELKRKCIRECNIALKMYRPQKDEDRVIFYAVGKLGCDMLFAPSPPFPFYKIICDLFPEWEKLNDDERINQLMTRLSRFIATNITWAEVIFNI